MSNGKVNERILELINELTNDDKILADFLKDLLLDEIQNQGQWQWNKIYRELIVTYSSQWSDKYED